MYRPERGVLKRSQFYFHTASQAARNGLFHLVCAGHFFCTPEYRVERPTFQSYLLMYLRRGQGYVRLDGRAQPLSAGHVVLLNCHQPHLYYTETGWETLWVHFNGTGCGHFFEPIAQPGGSVVNLGASNLIPDAIETMLEGLRTGRMAHDTLLSCYLHRMLAEVSLVSTHQGGSHDRGGPVLDTLEYIHTHFQQKITVADLASHSNLSVFHFSRLFKSQTGYSPHEYLLKTRLDRARTLLKSTNLTVKEIAHEVGFRSAAHFVQTFHEAASMTPLVFRETPL